MSFCCSRGLASEQGSNHFPHGGFQRFFVRAVKPKDALKEFFSLDLCPSGSCQRLDCALDLRLWRQLLQHRGDTWEGLMEVEG